MTNRAFKTGESRQQPSLLPPRIEHYVGPDNPVRAIESSVLSAAPLLRSTAHSSMATPARRAFLRARGSPNRLQSWIWRSRLTAGLLKTMIRRKPGIDPTVMGMAVILVGKYRR